MTTRPATPLPWRTSPSKPAEVQQESGKFTVGLMGMDGAVNAAYIVQAANSYPRLVEALKNALEHPGDPNQIGPAEGLLRELGELSE